MTTEWVFILQLLLGGSPSLTTVEMQNKEACIAAIEYQYPLSEKSLCINTLTGEVISWAD